MTTAELLASCTSGIIFTAGNVRSVREGRKTRTMRVMKPQPSAGVRGSVFVPSGVEDGHGREIRPRYKPGHRYYVKEPFCCEISANDGGYTGLVLYRVDSPRALAFDYDGSQRFRQDGTEASPWCSPMRMPRESARYVIEILAATAMRLQDITEEMAIEEGMRKLTKDGRLFKVGWPDHDGLPGTDNVGEPWSEWSTDFRIPLARRWDQINKHTPWASNPWVTSYKFRCLNGTPTDVTAINDGWEQLRVGEKGGSLCK